MASKIKTPIEEALDQANDLTNGEINYVNNVRINVNANEVTLDLYVVVPNPKNISQPIASHIYRCVMPLNVAKQLSVILDNGITQIENIFGINFPYDLNQEEADKVIKDE